MDPHDWFSADRPVRGRSADRLNRRNFAEAIAKALKGWKGRESLVVALYGSWGTGKSSIKNMVLETLGEHQEDVVVVEFNPWQYGGRDQLTTAFFDEIGIALGRGDLATKHTRRRLLSRWRRYAAYLIAADDLLALLRKPVALVLGLGSLLLFLGVVTRAPNLAVGLYALLLGAVAALLTFSSKFASTVAKFLEIGLDRGAKSIREIREELANDLQQVQAPVLVVMDDVDRLTPAETLELFQLVKANADFPNLIYLILCDRGVVEANIGRVLALDGRQYLEKIVQVGFDVPIIDRTQLQRLLFSGLDEALSDATMGSLFDQRRWGNVFLGGLDGYFENLRDVNRFLSTLSFHVSLFQQEASFEVNPIDLIVLEVLRVFEPEVYRGIALSKSVLAPRSGLEAALTESDTTLVRGIIERSSADSRKRVEEIIKQIFPTVERALGGTSYAASFAETWQRELRVCSAEIFDRYFHLAIPAGDISQGTIDKLISLSGNRGGLSRELSALSEQGLLAVALDRLEVHKESVPVTNAVPFVTALFDIGDSLPPEQAGLYEIGPTMKASRIVYRYLRRLEDRGERETVLKAAVRDTTSVGFPTNFISIEDQAAGEDRDPARRLVSDPVLDELKQECVAKIEEAAKAGTLDRVPGLLGILYRWREWGGMEAARVYCASLLSTHAGTTLLLKTFLLRAVSHGLGDRVGKERWYMELRQIEEFVDLVVLEGRLSEIDKSRLTEDERRAIGAFEKAVRRRREGKPERSGPPDFDD